MLRQIIRYLLRSGNKKAANQLLKTHRDKITPEDIQAVMKVDRQIMGTGPSRLAKNKSIDELSTFLKPTQRAIPHKSQGVAGVSVKTPGNITYKELREIERGYTPNAMLSPKMDALSRARYSDEFGLVIPKIGKHAPVNPLKARIRERILQMRKRPGIAKGLQRLESRKASALNTPGTPWSNKALRYEPTVGRAANFNSLFAKDKGFRDFLRDTVGNKELKSLSPKARDGLAKRYLTLKRKNINAAEAYSREMDIMEGPNEQYSRMIRGLADEL